MTDKARQMYRHDEFSEQVVNVKVDGLDFSMTDESVFKTSDRMKNLEQLNHDTDSLQLVRDSISIGIHRYANGVHMRRVRNKYENDTVYQMAIDTASYANVDSIARTLTPYQVRQVYELALRQAKNNKQFVQERQQLHSVEKTKVVRHQMEKHRKFTMPAACLLFFFIGAPLGAIIRKGGLGMPVVVSVLFFIFYYVIDTLGAKFAREFVTPVAVGMWLSTAVLAAIGGFLTYKSVTDSALFKSEAYGKVWDKMQKTLKRFLPRKKTDNQQQ